MINRYTYRTIYEAILEASHYFPVVTLTSPRQSGKSTLLRHLYPDLPYMSMEASDTRQKILSDPRPFFTNMRKRLTKSPKIYFTDCGLAAWLLDIDSTNTMNLNKRRGYLFEKMVIINFLKTRLNHGLSGDYISTVDQTPTRSICS